MARDDDRFADLFPGFAFTTKRMFGGTSFYHDGLIFGIEIDDRIYLKVDEINEPAYQAEGCGRFTYHRKDGKDASMNYCVVPDRLLDDPDELVEWARAAYAASIRVKAAAAAPKPKKPKKLKEPTD